MPSDLSEALLASIPDGKVLDVRIGLSWTAVVVEIAGARRCGLAATLRGERGHGSPTMPDAGHLVERSARELAIWASQDRGNLTQTSVGFATLNALLAAAAADQQWTDLNAAEVIAERGVGKRVALVGHFPFVEQLREQVGALWVLELQPQPGDRPASAAAEILPQADIIAVTATTLINGTFAGLMALANPVALTMLLGPSTPLSPKPPGTRMAFTPCSRSVWSTATKCSASIQSSTTSTLLAMPPCASASLSAPTPTTPRCMGLST